MTAQQEIPFTDAETPTPTADEPAKGFDSGREIIEIIDPGFDPDDPSARDGEWAAFADFW